MTISININIYYIYIYIYSEILGDRKRIQQILLNLLTNAIKFTLKGKIKLSIWEDSPNSKLFFQVSDSGVGIKEKDLSKLFQAFGMISDTKNINKFGIYIYIYLYIYIYI